MKQNLINDIESQMQRVLDNRQLEELHRVLIYCMHSMEVSASDSADEEEAKYVEMFLAAKKIEGRSNKSLKYYQSTIEKMVDKIGKTIKHITTDDLRCYLSDYQKENNSSKVTIDNIRRILSSFFGWLEDEDYILKSPVRRIHKVKTGRTIKETYTDEELEQMRDSCGDTRDLAIIDMLASTGMRVGEMVLLNREDINFDERECIVFGKGDKERIVYFDARTKMHL